MLSNNNEFTVTLPELKPINGGLWIRQLVLLGTGNSASMPKLSCVLPRDQQLDAVCPACSDAVDPSKVWSPNRRLNTSAVLCYQAEDGPLKHILIDCGKTFYSAAARWMVPYRIGRLEAVLLTHDHADALFGLDDLRHWTFQGAIQPSLSVYLDADTMATVRQVYPYLVDSKMAKGSGYVSDLNFCTFSNDQPFKINDSKLSIRPVSLEHGTMKSPEGIQRPYFANGFAFPAEQGQILYLSDVKAIPQQTDLFIRSINETIQLVILDCLRDSIEHKSHFVLEDVYHFVSLYNPPHTVLVGMDHEVEHYSFQAKIDREWNQLNEGRRILVGHDGMIIKFATT